MYGPVLVSGPPARPRSAVAAGAAAAPRPAAPDGSKPPFLPRDYEKGVVDGRARAYRGSGPRPVRARLGPSRPPLSHTAWAVGASVECVLVVGSLTLDWGLRNLSRELARSTTAICIYITSCRGTT